MDLLDKGKNGSAVEIAERNAGDDEIRAARAVGRQTCHNARSGIGEDVDAMAEAGGGYVVFQIASQHRIDLTSENAGARALACQPARKNPGAGAEFEDLAAVVRRHRRDHFIDEKSLGRDECPGLALFAKAGN